MYSKHPHTRTATCKNLYPDIIVQKHSLKTAKSGKKLFLSGQQIKLLKPRNSDTRIM